MPFPSGMLLSPAAVVAAAPSSTQWRLLFPTPNILSTDTTVVYEVEMRQTIGGADECTGGTASASTVATNAAFAFNNNGKTDFWSSTAGGVGSDQWLQYTFTSPKTIREITILPFDATHISSTIRVQYHDGTTWQTYWEVTGVFDWANDTTRTLSIIDGLFTVKPTIGGSYAIAGDVATVSFTASAGVASYQWYYDGIAIIGATSSSYTRTDSASCLLTCEVTLTYGTVVSSYKAHVFAPNGGAFSGRVYDLSQAALLKQNSDGTGTVSADGDPVAWVKDIAGGGSRQARHLTQTVATGRRPLYRSSAGINSLEFDGFDDYFSMPDLAYFTQGHFLASLKRDLDPSTTDRNAGPPIGQSGSNTGSDHHPYTDGNIYNGFMSTGWGNIGNPATSMTAWHYQDMWSVTNDRGLAINGTNFFTTATNTVAKSAVPMIGSHQRNRGDAGTYWDGRMGRIILSETKLTGNALSSARAWLQEQYT